MGTFANITFNGKWFEPRVISYMFNVIVWLRVVLRKTAVGTRSHQQQSFSRHSMQTLFFSLDNEIFSHYIHHQKMNKTQYLIDICHLPVSFLWAKCCMVV